MLVSGVLTDEVIAASTIGTTVNHMVEGFVKAATELPRGVRINCVSPTVLAESTDLLPFFPGFVPVSAAEVALAYLPEQEHLYVHRAQLASSFPLPDSAPGRAAP